MTLQPLIEYTRAQLAEVIHTGVIAVADANGRLIAEAGDAELVCFTRSTLKPFQALPLVMNGGVRHFGFSEAQVAMLCASHNGEDMHVAQVEDMLQKTGHDRKILQCGCHVPLRFTYANIPAPADLIIDERHNNCSGKHAGFVAYCVQHGLNLQDHLQPDHPLQVAIRLQLARLVQLDEDGLIIGTDGCSAPNYAMPLSRLAFAFARLASGEADREFGEAFGTLRNAMLTHPEMVSGTDRNDYAFVKAGRGDWITKIGADGVQVIASLSRRHAIAVKIQSGQKTPLYAAAIEAMDQLGWLDEEQRKQLKP